MNAHRSIRPLRLTALALALAALPSLGCGPSAGASGPDAAARAIAGADARLRGAWKLVKFVPETPLEPTLEALIQMQYATMSVRFEQARMKADSPAMHIDRAYRITEVIGDRFKLTSYDELGVPYDMACSFANDDTIQVVSMTPPWRGVATLARDLAPNMMPGIPGMVPGMSPGVR